MITDRKLLANKFNNFFINVAENLSKKIKKKTLNIKTTSKILTKVPYF